MGFLSWLPPLRRPDRDQRSLENPTTSLSNPSAWLMNLFGSASDSGVAITPAAALSVATFWQCIHLLADDFGKLPTVVFKNKKNESHVKDREHPAYYLLRRKTNEFMTAGVFKRTILHHALIHGNGYGWILRDGGAAPTELLLLDPERTSPKWVGSKLWYDTWVGNKQYTLRPDEVFHLRGIGFDGTRGYSVVQYAANSLGLSLAAEKFGSKLFANGSKSSGVLHYPGRLKPEAKQNLKDSFEKAHQGLDNAHRTIVLEEGAKYEPLTIPPNEAQFIELREFQRKEIASWFKIPPSKLGDPDSVSYNSLEQWNQAYLESALDPWLVAFEEEAYDKLLTEVQKRRESHFVEFNRAALLRTSLKDRYEAYAMARQWGWFSINDIRSKENEPLLGPEGDSYLVPQNMADLKNLDKLGLKPPGQGGAPSKDVTQPKTNSAEPVDVVIRDTLYGASRELLEDTFGRMTRRLAGTLTTASKKRDFFDRLVPITEEHLATFARIAQPVLNVVASNFQPDLPSAGSLGERHLAEVMTELRALQGSSDVPAAVVAWAQKYEAEAVVKLMSRFGEEYKA